MRLMPLLMLAVAIAGCASNPTVTGNSESVVMENVSDDAVALRRADEHCARYGKVARIAQRQDFRATFHCVSAK